MTKYTKTAKPPQVETVVIPDVTKPASQAKSPRDTVHDYMLPRSLCLMGDGADEAVEHSPLCDDMTQIMSHALDVAGRHQEG